MPTSYNDQFFSIDPFSPPGRGTAMNFTNLSLTDQNDDGDLDRFDNDTIDGVDITASWPGDTVTIRIPGTGVVTYTGTTFYLADGRTLFTPTDGQVLENGRLISATGVSTEGPLLVGDLGPPCFTPGTLIETAEGNRLVETLKPGDLVVTRDNGMQPILWVGREKVPAVDNLAPVLFAKGALGNTRPLLVSQQHRMLIDDWRAEYFCGFSEVFTAAKHLVNGTTVTIVEGGVVEYLHLLFADHEVIYSNGIPTESYFPGHALGKEDDDARSEIEALFPALDQTEADIRQTARPVSHAREAQLMALCA